MGGTMTFLKSGYISTIRKLHYRNRFVIAPIYVVPFSKGGGTFSPMNLLLAGWQVSGIATFATGSPFDIYASATSNSLWCSSSSTFYACPDIPNQTAPLIRGNLRKMNVNSAGASNQQQHLHLRS
jgi:hypothetical protein